MHRIFRVKAYEKEHGPHFNEEYARKAVMKMENEDGTRGPHWSVVSVSGAYDEPLPTNQFPMPNQPRKKVVDVTIQCNGESRKFTIPENKSVITDTNLGLTISTDKQEIVNILRNQYNTYKARKESIAKCDEEMSKCQALLEKLDIPKEPTNTEDPRIKELQDEVNELKNIIKQASSMVPPPMKQMLPQNMQNVMKEVDQ